MLRVDLDWHPAAALSPHRPVVGVLTQPGMLGEEYVAASYVKLVEASGARVVPIRFWWSERELSQVFSGLSGIVLPGGGASLDPKDSVLLRPVQILYNLAEKQNKVRPNSVFIFGICLGWEVLAMVAAKDFTLLQESGQFDDQGVSKTLLAVDRRSALFRDLPPGLEHKAVFFFHHEMGVSPEVSFFLPKEEFRSPRDRCLDSTWASAGALWPCKRMTRAKVLWPPRRATARPTLECNSIPRRMPLNGFPSRKFRTLLRPRA
jgi:GMP synthase-like glutamine amidotransferase